jgi:hypothetical protein
MAEENGTKVWYRSKTIWFNAILGSAVAFCLAIGYPLPEEVVAAIVTLGNIILRMITTEAVTATSSE